MNDITDGNMTTSVITKWHIAVDFNMRVLFLTTYIHICL